MTQNFYTERAKRKGSGCPSIFFIGLASCIMAGLAVRGLIDVATFLIH